MEDGKVIQEKVSLPANLTRQELAANLLPAMVEIFAQSGWSKASLDMVVAGVGPGSFTNIRSAVVVARSLAYALKLPLIGISQFDVIASFFSGPVGIVLPAYRDFVYACVLELSQGGETQVLVEPLCVELLHLAQLLSATPQWVLGQDAIKLPLPPGITLSSIPPIINTATRQAEIVWNRVSLEGGNCSTERLSAKFPWKLVKPLYLREPSVTLKA